MNVKLNSQINSFTEYLETIRQFSDEHFTIENFASLKYMSGDVMPQSAVELRKIQTKWFRGQASDWALIPKIYRPNCLCNETDMMLECRRKAFILEKVPAWEDVGAWLFLMQHHGLPTRLLDWTESSAAALFFAIERWAEYEDPRIKSDFHPVVWVLNPNSLNWVGSGSTIIPGTGEDEAVTSHGEIDKEFGTRSIKAAFSNDSIAHQNPLAIYNKNVHVRMQVQRSRFTVHGKDKRSINDIFAGTDLINNHLLHRININPTSADRIKNELREIGISRSTLFPDLEGVAQDLTNDFRIIHIE